MAQLVAHLLCKQGVRGSSPLGSTAAASAAAGRRDDIQGLRAVAVSAVVLDHAGLGPFSGGFVGVDVFFVISGFLITQLLLRERARTGRVSLVGFYGRRARRILPAATLVLLATIVASTLWLGVFRVGGVLRDAVWAALFAANIRFAHEGTDYFTQDQPPSPLQHYWSLSVEEQFYLVWPLALIVVLFLARGRARTQAQTPALRALAGVLAVTVAVSLAWSVHQTGTDPTVAYFSTLTRAWELGIGALAAVLLAARGAAGAERAPRPVVLEVVAALGLVAIGFACLRYDVTTPFPGWAALVPVVGTAAVLLAGGLSASSTWSARLLSVRPLRAIGDWSYSLYLWHWPLLVIPAAYLAHTLSTVESAALVGLAVLLSWVTYRWVETPLRTPRRWTIGRGALLLYPVTVALVIGTALGANAYLRSSLFDGTAPAVTLGPDWRENYQVNDRSAALVLASIEAAREHRPVPGKLRPELVDLLDSVPGLGECDYDDDTVRVLCPHGDTASDRTLVVIGNSHARHWIPAFDILAREAGYRTYYLAKVQCVGALVIPDRAGSDQPFSECGDFHEWALDQVAELDPDLVVLSTSSPHGVWDDDGVRHTDHHEVDQLLYQGYVDILRAIGEHADRTVLLEDIPGSRTDPAPCLSGRPASLGTCLMPEVKDYRRTISVQQRAAQTAGAETVRTGAWFCRDGVCPSVVGDMIVYRDGRHMTNEYSASLADSLGRKLGLHPSTPGE